MKFDLDTITFGGYTLKEIRTMQSAVHKDAVVFVSDGLDEALTLLGDIVEMAGEDAVEVLDAEGVELAQSKIDEATKLLKAVNTVATISGVTYYLPFYSSYGDYYDERPWSGQIEDLQSSLEAYGLYSVLENMESSSREWNESRC